MKAADAKRAVRNPMERLAREICWAEFVGPKCRIGSTKAAYWNKMPDDRREMYLAQARWFVFILRALPIDALNEAHNIGERRANA